MRKVSIDGVAPAPFDDVHSDRRGLTDPLNTSDVAIARYVLQPGERFSGSVHAHADQEEVFIVLEGAATFETRAPAEGTNRGSGAADRADDEPAIEGGEVTVAAGEAIRFAPGEFQSGRNDGDGKVVAFALGAPRDTEDVRVSRIPVLGDRNVACPDCGREDMRIPDGDEAGLTCPDCGATLSVE